MLPPGEEGWRIGAEFLALGGFVTLNWRGVGDVGRGVDAGMA